MTKTIIGIHGLANKPEKPLLEQWWKDSIHEGLKVNCAVDNPNFNFRLVYWADLLYKYPVHQDSNFSFDKLYNDEPYTPAAPGALRSYKESLADKLRSGALGLFGDGADALKEHFGMNALTDWLLDKLLKDLAFYYDNDRKILNRAGSMELARNVLKSELKTAIREEKNQQIMVVAHSMGSIIGYDALRDLGQSDPDIRVSHLVTIGSPLGLPHVRGKIIKERNGGAQVRTPSIIGKSWLNFADKKDPVAMDVHLRNDYDKNANGVQVVDDLVANDYVEPGKPDKHNHHKSYGYLRTPEFSNHLKAFLDQ